MEKILLGSKPLITTMGKPESREECEAVNVKYLPEFEQQELLMARAIMKSPKIVFISNYVKEFWRDIFRLRGLSFPPDDKVKVIYHGVDVNRFTPSPKSLNTPFVLGSSGALRGRFRLATLFATSRLLEFDHRLLIVGSMDSECKDEYEKAMVDPAMAARTKYVSWVDIELLPDYYRQMHCLFHPRFGEPFGIVLAEALACGVPVVVPAYGGPKEFVAPDGGIAVECERWKWDNEFCRQMALAIIKIRNDYANYADAARKRAVEHLSIEKTVDEYLDFMKLPRWIKRPKG
jgi:glycosyltransferase involved in cell wall biosynthesis